MGRKFGKLTKKDDKQLWLELKEAYKNLETGFAQLRKTTEAMVEQGNLTSTHVEDIDQAQEYTRERVRKLLSWMAYRANKDHKEVWAQAYDLFAAKAGYHPATEVDKGESCLDVITKRGDLSRFFGFVKELFMTA